MYHYENEKPKIFTEENQVNFLKTRDNVEKLLRIAGAFKIVNVTVSGDGWLAMAYVDRLVELDEIKEITDNTVMGQDRVFVSNKIIE